MWPPRRRVDASLAVRHAVLAAVVYVRQYVMCAACAASVRLHAFLRVELCLLV